MSPQSEPLIELADRSITGGKPSMLRASGGVDHAIGGHGAFGHDHGHVTVVI